MQYACRASVGSVRLSGAHRESERTQLATGAPRACAPPLRPGRRSESAVETPGLSLLILRNEAAARALCASFRARPSVKRITTVVGVTRDPLATRATFRRGSSPFTAASRPMMLTRQTRDGVVPAQPALHISAKPSDRSTVNPDSLGEPAHQRQCGEDPPMAPRDARDFVSGEEFSPGRVSLVHPPGNRNANWVDCPGAGGIGTHVGSYS